MVLIQSGQALIKMVNELFFERHTSAGLEEVRCYVVQKPSWKDMLIASKDRAISNPRANNEVEASVL